MIKPLQPTFRIGAMGYFTSDPLGALIAHLLLESKWNHISLDLAFRQNLGGTKFLWVDQHRFKEHQSIPVRIGP